MKSLRLLVRGDFLCEALEILKEETGDQIPLLAIEEFWASEDYYFHDAQQVSSIELHFTSSFYAHRSQKGKKTFWDLPRVKASRERL